MYSMGEEAEDILKSFRLSDTEQKLYKTVRGKFELFFVKKRTIFDWISFFQRSQEEGEPVASFVNDIYALAKYCNRGSLHDEMFKDILVASIHNKRLSKRLQLDGNLTLEKGCDMHSADGSGSPATTFSSWRQHKANPN